MSLQQQNALFPNNIELRLKKELGKVTLDKTEAEKNLEVKLEEDEQALQHQKYLISGVINKYGNKKHTASTAHKSLVNL